MARFSARRRWLFFVLVCVPAAIWLTIYLSPDSGCRLQLRNRTGLPLSNVRLTVSGRESSQAVLGVGEDFTIPVDDSEDMHVTYDFSGPDGAGVTGNVGFAGGKRPWKHGLLIVTVKPGMVV